MPSTNGHKGAGGLLGGSAPPAKGSAATRENGEPGAGGEDEVEIVPGGPSGDPSASEARTELVEGVCVVEGKPPVPMSKTKCEGLEGDFSETASATQRDDDSEDPVDDSESEVDATQRTAPTVVEAASTAPKTA